MADGEREKAAHLKGQWEQSPGAAGGSQSPSKAEGGAGTQGHIGSLLISVSEVQWAQQKVPGVGRGEDGVRKGVRTHMGIRVQGWGVIWETR